MSPTCSNCGSHLSSDYLRVCVPDDEDGIQACPHCNDRIRRGGGWREYRYDWDEHQP